MPKKIWKDTWEYKRILEILEDYWLTEPDELIVRVNLEFVHASKGHQEKEIWWRNPNYEIQLNDEDEDGYPPIITFDLEEVNKKLESLPSDYFLHDMIKEFHRKES